MRIGNILCVAVVATLAGLPAASYAEKKYDPGVTDTTIKIGQTTPLSGPVSAYGTFSRAALAFFAMINDQGGINGRKVNLLIADDGFSPPKTVEQTRKLVELDGVFLMFAPVGTAPNVAIRKYLNARKVPQLFLQSGISLWNDPAHYPWSMSGLPNYGTESRQYGKYILDHRPNARVAILYQHDDFGREYLDGITEGLGANAKKMIVAQQSFELTDPTVDSQIIELSASGADTFLIASTAKQAIQALKKAHEIGWHPLTFVSFVAASVERTLIPAGVEASRGVISATVFMDPRDPTFRDDPAMKMYSGLSPLHTYADLRYWWSERGRHDR